MMLEILVEEAENELHRGVGFLDDAAGFGRG